MFEPQLMEFGEEDLAPDNRRQIIRILDEEKNVVYPRPESPPPKKNKNSGGNRNEQKIEMNLDDEKDGIPGNHNVKEAPACRPNFLPWYYNRYSRKVPRSAPIDIPKKIQVFGYTIMSSVGTFNNSQENP